MAVEQISLELIDDNPYNPRKHYSPTKVKEMAQSLREVGLRQVPEGRHVDGKIQIAYGHMRLQGFRYNQKHDPYPENEKMEQVASRCEGDLQPGYVPLLHGGESHQNRHYPH